MGVMMRRRKAVGVRPRSVIAGRQRWDVGMVLGHPGVTVSSLLASSMAVAVALSRGKPSAQGSMAPPEPFRNPVLRIVGVVILFLFFAPGIAWIAFLSVPIIAWLSFHHQERAASDHAVGSQNWALPNSQLINNLEASATVKIFGAETYEIDRIHCLSQAYRHSNHRIDTRTTAYTQAALRHILELHRLPVESEGTGRALDVTAVQDELVLHRVTAQDRYCSTAKTSAAYDCMTYAPPSASSPRTLSCSTGPSMTTSDTAASTRTRNAYAAQPVWLRPILSSEPCHRGTTP